MRTVLDELGGEDALKTLVETFYDVVETEPRAQNLRHLHFNGHGIDHARIEQFNFLSSFMGGRQYYKEKHGHMDVRHMHEHVEITLDDAEVWLQCMTASLDKCCDNAPLKDRLMGSFRRVARVLVNQA